MVSHMASHMEVAGVPPAVLQELWEVFDGKERGARRRAAFEAAREGAAWWADRAGSGRSVAELMQARERASRASVHGQQRLLEPRLAVLIELEGVQAAWAEAAAAATARQRVSEACAAARVWWIAAAPAGGDAEAMRRLALLRMLAPVRERHAACVICRSTRRRGYHRRRGVATHESASYSPLFGLRYHLRIWHRFSRQCLVLERSSRRLLLHSRREKLQAALEAWQNSTVAFTKSIRRAVMSMRPGELQVIMQQVEQRKNTFTSERQRIEEEATELHHKAQQLERILQEDVGGDASRHDEVIMEAKVMRRMAAKQTEAAQQRAVQEEQLSAHLNELKSAMDATAHDVAVVKSSVSMIAGELSRSVRTLTYLAEGETSCPQLFVITPAARSLFAIGDWFSQPLEVRFLCAYDFSPVDPAISIRQPDEFVRQCAPALLLGLKVLKSVLQADGILEATGLRDMLPFLSEADSTLDRIDALRGALIEQAGGKAQAGGSGALDKLEDVLDEAGGSSTTDLHAAQRLTGPAFRVVASLAEEQRVLARLPMVKMVDLEGTVAWVKEENSEHFKAQAKSSQPSHDPCAELELLQMSQQRLEAEKEELEQEAKRLCEERRKAKLDAMLAQERLGVLQDSANSINNGATPTAGKQVAMEQLLESEARRKCAEEESSRLAREEQTIGRRLRGMKAQLGAISGQLSTVSEKMSQVAGELSRSVRTLTYLAEGETSCPQLFVITPAARSLFAIGDWFSQPLEVRFLCAYDFSPVDPAISIRQPDEFVRQCAPALLLGLKVLKSVLQADGILEATGLRDMLPFLSEADSTLDRIDALRGALIEQAGGKAQAGGSGALDKLEDVLDEAGGSSTTDLHAAQRLTGPAFRVVASLAEEQRVLARLPMVKMVDLEGTVAWVKEDNVASYQKRSPSSAPKANVAVSAKNVVAMEHVAGHDAAMQSPRPHVEEGSNDGLFAKEHTQGTPSKSRQQSQQRADSAGGLMSSRWMRCAFAAVQGAFGNNRKEPTADSSLPSEIKPKHKHLKPSTQTDGDKLTALLEQQEATFREAHARFSEVQEVGHEVAHGRFYADGPGYASPLAGYTSHGDGEREASDELSSLVVEYPSPDEYGRVPLIGEHPGRHLADLLQQQESAFASAYASLARRHNGTANVAAFAELDSANTDMDMEYLPLYP